MPNIIVHRALHSAPLDDALHERLAAALTAFASSPDDVRIAAGFCLDAVAAALAHCISRHLPVDDQLEHVLFCMEATIQDFDHPDDFACDLAALLYAPVELATAHLDLTPPPRMREAIACALARGFRRDTDLLPFQAWTLARALHDAVQAGSTAIATACLADVCALALAPPRDGEDSRYRHEPDQRFLNPGGEEDEEEEDAPFPHPIEIFSVYDPAIPLEQVLQSTDVARSRLTRLIERQRVLCRQEASDGAMTALLAERIAAARSFIAGTEAGNDTIRRERAKRLN